MATVMEWSASEFEACVQALRLNSQGGAQAATQLIPSAPVPALHARDAE